MLSLETALTFGMASFFLCIAPGPDNIFVLAQSVIHGRKAAILVTLGLCTGLIFHTSLISMGIAAIFHSSEYAFHFLKFAGAGYLLYLAWKAFRSEEFEIESKVQIKLSKLYCRGIIMNVTNPKVSLFFLAFLPQFISEDKDLLTQQIFQLGVIFIFVTFVVFCAFGIVAGYLVKFLRRHQKHPLIVRRITGLLFLGLALRLLVLQQ